MAKINRCAADASLTLLVTLAEGMATLRVSQGTDTAHGWKRSTAGAMPAYLAFKTPHKHPSTTQNGMGCIPNFSTPALEAGESEVLGYPELNEFEANRESWASILI